MATVDNFDIKVYIEYAQRAEFVEAVRREFRLGEAESIPPQTQVVDFQPKPSEIDLLLGVGKVATPWATFSPPPQFKSYRQSPFSIARVAPTLGSQTRQEAQEEKIGQIECRTAEEEREKHVLIACFQTISKVNGWLEHVVTRVLQFLQA